MTEDRYDTIETTEGWYVYDMLDEKPIGEPLPIRLGADILAERMNRREPVQENLIEAIRLERRRQDGKWGNPKHGSVTWLAILGEEFGEVSRSLIEHKNSDKNLEKELVQLAASALAWLESIEKSR